MAVLVLRIRVSISNHKFNCKPKTWSNGVTSNIKGNILISDVHTHMDTVILILILT